MTNFQACQRSYNVVSRNICVYTCRLLVPRLMQVQRYMLVEQILSTTTHSKSWEDQEERDQLQVIMKHYHAKPSAHCTSLALQVSQKQCCWQVCMPCIIMHQLYRNLQSNTHVVNHKNVYYTLLCNCNRPRVCLVSRISTRTSQEALADSLACSVMSQSGYRTYHQTNTLVFLKRSHCCLFCSPKVR